MVAKFDKVTKLHVNNITINSWEEVSKLRWFPSLNDVRMVHWDLFGVCFLFEECYYDTCLGNVSLGFFGVCYIVTLLHFVWGMLLLGNIIGYLYVAGNVAVSLQYIIVSKSYK